MATLQDGEGLPRRSLHRLQEVISQRFERPISFLSLHIHSQRAFVFEAGASRANDPLAEHDLRMLPGLRHAIASKPRVKLMSRLIDGEIFNRSLCEALPVF